MILVYHYSTVLLMTYVAYYYYRYFTRVNPLPGPFPLPLIGNIPYILWFKGEPVLFYKYCYEKYGDIYELHGVTRSIMLCRAEYLDDFFSKSMHELRFNNHYKGLEELGMVGKGIFMNSNYKSWLFNRHFFNQAILSPDFTNEAIDCTNELFNELESYWDKLFLKEEIIKENKNKLDFSKWFNHYENDMIIKLLTGERSYSMAAYFETLSDEKSDHQSAKVEDSAKLFQALHKSYMEQPLFFIMPPFLRHYVPFFKNMADNALQNMRFINQELNAIIMRRKREIENIPLDEPLPNDMMTSMIINNTSRDANYVKVGESANRSLTNAEIRVNLLDGINNGIYKVSIFLEKFYVRFISIIKI
jgi:hypothetical protein